MEKNYLFQYAYNEPMCTIVEDTDLITKKQAEDLWDKYYLDVVEKLNNGGEPQMCIWKDADSNVSYHTILKEIDFRDDLETKDNTIYKIEKVKLI